MFDNRSQPKKEGLTMEIISRLREEREVLVARIAQINKMLQQYDEWGREAQRLLSLTGSQGATANTSTDANLPSVNVDDAEASDHKPVVRSGGIRRRTTFPKVGAKTPMREFEAAVIEVLRASAEPLDRIGLYDALIDRGIVIGDGDRDRELNALSARVYRMAQDPKNGISSERGQGYRLITDQESLESESVDGGAVDDEDRDSLI
jgi:hypothetical protein